MPGDEAGSSDAERRSPVTDGPCLSAAAHAEQVISLCVGGTLFSTTLGTLTAIPGSYLAILLGGSHWRPSCLLPGSKTPFIDRDGELFRFVLAYLRLVRNCEQHQQLLLLPDNPTQLQLLKAEADFYGLPGLALACSLGRCGTRPGSAWARAAAQQLQQAHHTTPHHSTSTPTTGQQQHQIDNSDSPSKQLPQLRQPAPQLQQQDRSQDHHHSCLGDAQVSVADVQLSLNAQASRPTLIEAALQAQQLLASQQQGWAQDAALQQYAGIVLRHMLSLPLSAQQPDLVAALASATGDGSLEFRFAYHPVGDTRIDIQCKVMPANADQTTAIAAAAAAAGVGAAAGSSVSPGPSPRDNSQPQRRYSSSDAAAAMGSTQSAATAAGADGGSDAISSGHACSGCLPPEAAGVAAVAAAAAAAVAVNSYGAAVMPGPGWGHATIYHRFTIKELQDRFVLTTQHPGEPQQVREVAHTIFRPELKLLSSLHKLCVQQCPRSSVAGLAWLLEEAGFSSVQLSNSLESYHVGRNTFSGFTGIITCRL